MSRIGLLASLLLAGCQGEPSTASPSLVSIDTTQMFADVAFLAHDSLQGRATGTVGNRQAREYIVGAFGDIGLEAFDGGYTKPFTFERGGNTIEGANVVGYVPGTAAGDTYIVVTAHYDHLGVRDGEVFNGADDNASGTAGLLAIARFLVANPPRHSVILAALDAEERGLRGARAFVEDPPVPLAGVVLNINLDMVSRSEGVLYAAGTHHYPYLRPYLESVPLEPGVVLAFGHDSPDLPSGDDWTNSSDHGPFHAAGIPFVYFGVEDHPDYHRSTDDFETRR